MKINMPKKSRQELAFEFQMSLQKGVKKFNMKGTGADSMDQNIHAFRTPIKRNIQNMVTIRHQILDAIWVIKYEPINDSRVKLIAYYRDHTDNKSVKIGERTGFIIEEGKRIATKIVTYDEQDYMMHPKDIKNKVELIIDNPQHIFKYGTGQ